MLRQKRYFPKPIAYYPLQLVDHHGPVPRAASGPSDRSTARPSSSSTGTPSDSALSSLDPAFDPATTKLVFFDTEPDTFPPSAWIASAASSLVRPSSVPVSTTVTPASGPPAAAPASSRGGGTKPGVDSCTPAARHLSTIAACQSTSNHSRTDRAMVGPTSFTATRSASGAAAIAST